MAVVDDLRRSLDNGWTVMLRRNELNSYTAVAIAEGQEVTEALEIERQITDDFTPERALCRLSEKMIGNIL